MPRRTLPPGVKKVALKSGELRYEVVVDAGEDPNTGKRRQTRKRYATLDEADAALAEVKTQVSQGGYVAKSVVTVDMLIADYLASRHKARATTLAKQAYDLIPLRQRHGKLKVQALTRGQVDALVRDLAAGGTLTETARIRKPWAAVSVNRAIGVIRQVLDYAVEQGYVARNVAEKVERLPEGGREMETYTSAEVRKLLDFTAEDRMGHAWHLALSGLRRGELSGLRWSDVDLKAGTLTVANGRALAGNSIVEGDLKTVRARRTLPLPDSLKASLTAARARQARERLALGPGYGDWAYVVSNEAGMPYSPNVLTRMWAAAVKSAGVRHIRLHDARHTCATLMHLQGVPIAVISKWVGHAKADFTMRVYTHSQDDALKAAASMFDTACDKPVTADVPVTSGEEGQETRSSS